MRSRVAVEIHGRLGVVGGGQRWVAAAVVRPVVRCSLKFVFWLLFVGLVGTVFHSLETSRRKLLMAVWAGFLLNLGALLGFLGRPLLTRSLVTTSL